MDSRRKEGASPSTINRELAILRRAFNLAKQASPPKVRTVPYIPMNKENNVRTGFLRDEEYDKLAAECGKEGLWLRALLATGYNFAWRKGELLGLRVRQIDLASNTVTLDPVTTKNDDGRVITMTEEVRTLLTACIVAKQQDDYVFTREDGNRVKNFRKIWQSVCERASVPELLFHDLRRTGVRNLRRLGVAETTAMKISGHKTRSTFERYNIIDQRDLAEAAELLNAKQKSKALEFRSGSGRVATETENSQAPSLALGLLN